jgi:DHA1 family tetracycline resistance protein-like MFS transporter
MGIVMVGVQGGLIGKLVKTYGEPKLILAGTAICAAALVGFGLATAIPFLIVALVFLALGHGMLHPSLSSLASKGATPTTRGATMGVFQSAGSLARVLGPPCAGFLYDSIGPAFPFYGGSVLLDAAFSVMALKSGRLGSRTQSTGI